MLTEVPETFSFSLCGPAFGRWYGRRNASIAGALDPCGTHDLRIAMGKKEIRNRAEELLGQGYGKQQAFDHLRAEFPEAKPKRLAEVLRFMPTEMDQERYGGWQRTLLVVIALHALFRIFVEYAVRPVAQDGLYRYVLLVPIATALLGWSILRWRGQVFHWVGWMNVLGGMGLGQTLNGWAEGNLAVQPIVDGALTLAIGLLSLYLAHRVFPKYSLRKDAMGQAQPQILFHEGHAGSIH